MPKIKIKTHSGAKKRFSLTKTGNRCKVTVRFRGREMAHTNIGQDLLLKFAEECGELAVMDKSPKLEGRHMSIFLSPKPAKDAKK